MRVRRLLQRATGILRPISNIHLKVIPDNPGTGAFWYRYTPRRPIRPGWYMLSVASDKSILGHDFMLKPTGGEIMHLQIGSRDLSKRIIRLTEPAITLELGFSPGGDASTPIRFDLVRLSASFAHSRMRRKINYSSGLRAKSPQRDGDLFDFYQRLVERHFRRIDYTEWRRLKETRQLPDNQDTATQATDALIPLIGLVVPASTPAIEHLVSALSHLNQSARARISLVLNTDQDISTLESVINKSAITNGGGNMNCLQLRQTINGLGVEYIGLIGKDVMLTEDALTEVLSAIHKNPDAELFYSDNDVLLDDGERQFPAFKPAWNPELLLSGNYIGRFVFSRADLVAQVGGIDPEYGDSMEYDLLLRMRSKLNRHTVVRIPKPLFSRFGEESLAMPYLSVGNHDVPSLSRHLQQSEYRAEVGSGLLEGVLKVDWELDSPLPQVDIIIPSRDRVDLLQCCINSILELTRYPNFSITVVDNDSREQATATYYQEMIIDARVNLIQFPGEFNYSAINNHAVSKTTGDIVVLLNNDTEVFKEDWLTNLVTQASRSEVGCVGAKLYYSSGLIQHAGVIVGIKGVAGHSHRFYDGDANGFCCRLKMPQNVSAVTAACLAVRRSVFTEVGGLDEVNLKVAYNDIDFCLRVQDAGYQNVWTPFVELFHHESVSRGSDDTSKKAKRFQQEYDYMLERWNTDTIRDPAYNPNLALDLEDFSLAA